jgi:AP2 domain
LKINVQLEKIQKSGVLGVYQRTSKIWQARLGVNGKQINLGHWPSKEEAFNAYLKAKRKYHQGCTL